MLLGTLLFATVGNLVFLIVAVLLPIVPAALLYRLLPSDSKVEGPFQGLKIKLGGAFAGYFLVLLVVLGFAVRMPAYDVWTVRGEIHLEDGETLHDRALQFAIHPPVEDVSVDGAFELKVFRTPDQAGLMEFPRRLRVEYDVLEEDDDGQARPRYLPRSLDLEAEGRKDRMRRRLILTQPIVLPLDPSLRNEGR